MSIYNVTEGDEPKTRDPEVGRLEGATGGRGQPYSTGACITTSGRQWRREPAGPEWALERFPARR